MDFDDFDDFVNCEYTLLYLYFSIITAKRKAHYVY